MLLPALSIFISVVSAASLPVRSCDELIDELYRGYPCVPPSDELLERARADSDCLAETVFAPGVDTRQALGAYVLLLQAEAPGMREVILRAVRDERDRVRANAVHNLPMALSGDGLKAEYLRLMTDPDVGVRYNAVEGLTKVPTPDAVPALFRLLTDESIEIRHQALHTLARWNLPGTEEKLARSSHAFADTLAGMATFGLLHYYHRDADPAPVDAYLRRELRKLTGPPYAGTDAVVALVQVLGGERKPGRFASLRAATEHEHRSVRAAAREALGLE